MYNKSVWKKYGKNQKEIMDFSKGYKDFISYGKTERLVVEESIPMLESAGFVELSKVVSLKPGDKIYHINKKKNVLAMIVGNRPLTDGLRILGAHIDSPRIDLKQNPLYEKTGMALLDTHYYGGIKKYQWVTIPLALHGVVVKKDGTVVEIHIGEKDNDPVFGIGDLLIHLAADQMGKPGRTVVEGEDLDVTFGSIPALNTDKDAVKANVLKILKKTYDIEEEDFVSAEIEVVPAGKARDYGIDRGMVAGYGHDDRVCAYTSLKAILDLEETPEFASCCILVDKEEIGSVGATGAESLYFENILAKIAKLAKIEDPLYAARIILENSDMLSSDVSAGFDPLYPQVNDSNNACYMGNGIVFNKYTGARGKSGSNDSSAEYMAKIRRIMDENEICYQTSELGKVDQGGGGTIAYILGKYNMNVIDAGVGVYNMHAPMEIVSKADVYEAYIAYKAFLKSL